MPYYPVHTGMFDRSDREINHHNGLRYCETLGDFVGLEDREPGEETMVTGCALLHPATPLDAHACTQLIIY